MVAWRPGQFKRRSIETSMATAAAASAMESVASTAIGGAASEAAKTTVRAAAGDASEDPASNDDMNTKPAVAIKTIEILVAAAVTSVALAIFGKASDWFPMTTFRVGLALVLAVVSALVTAYLKTVFSG